MGPRGSFDFAFPLIVFSTVGQTTHACDVMTSRNCIGGDGSRLPERRGGHADAASIAVGTGGAFCEGEEFGTCKL